MCLAVENKNYAWYVYIHDSFLMRDYNCFPICFSGIKQQHYGIWDPRGRGFCFAWCFVGTAKSQHTGKNGISIRHPLHGWLAWLRVVKICDWAVVLPLSRLLSLILTWPPAMFSTHCCGAVQQNLYHRSLLSGSTSAKRDPVLQAVKD